MSERITTHEQGGTVIPSFRQFHLCSYTVLVICYKLSTYNVVHMVQNRKFNTRIKIPTWQGWAASNPPSPVPRALRLRTRPQCQWQRQCAVHKGRSPDLEAWTIENKHDVMMYYEYLWIALTRIRQIMTCSEKCLLRMGNSSLIGNTWKHCGSLQVGQGLGVVMSCHSIMI